MIYNGENINMLCMYECLYVYILQWWEVPKLCQQCWIGGTSDLNKKTAEGEIIKPHPRYPNYFWKDP